MYNELLNKYGHTLLFLYNKKDNTTSISEISTETLQSYNSTFNTCLYLNDNGYMDCIVERNDVFNFVLNEKAIKFCEALSAIN